ncbi:MAG: hypothetical protein IPI73_27850 [Betaproteobacteria bacterium]|nr:hypothetical protein [Betaproteobacteria bacterium]
MTSAARAGIPPALRAPLLIGAFVSLAAGVGAGLARMGWDEPVAVAALIAWHGPLMICGFFGTVISLERAVALGARWTYLGPLFAAIGGLTLVMGGPAVAATASLTLGSLVLVAASWVVHRMQPALHTLTILIAAACWAAGNALLAVTGAVAPALPWWIVFLVLTIAGERLELSRFLPPSPIARRVFAVLVGAMVAGALLAALEPVRGWIPFAGALLGLALWLGKQDIARRTVKERGLTGFIGACLLSGYAWLAFGAVMLFANGVAPDAWRWDAGLHAILIGFVFAMVFGHAPIIFPSVLRVTVPWHWTFYLPLALLHASLLLRVAGDLAQSLPLRAHGGAANAVALVTFVLSTIAAVVRGRIARARQGLPGGGR